MNLPAMNPICSLFIKEASSGFSLFATMLDLETYLEIEFKRVGGHFFFRSFFNLPLLGMHVMKPSIRESENFVIAEAF